MANAGKCMLSILFPYTFLNQAGAGHKPAHNWFLKIDPMRIVGMHVCVCVYVCMSVYVCVFVCAQGY